MASFSKGTSFTDGVTGDVTAAKLHALVDAATPVGGFVTDRTAKTSVVGADLVLVSDSADSNNLKKVTVTNFSNNIPSVNLTAGTIAAATLGTTTGTLATFTGATITNGTITTGLIPTATLGTTTGTAATFTNGTLTTGVIPTGTFGTTTSTAATVTNGTVTTLNSTTGTITNLTTTLAGDFTISAGTGTLGTTGVTAGTYGNATEIPSIVVNAKGQVTSVSTAAVTSGLTGFRNRIYNGEFGIAQRATSFVSGANDDDSYNLDRWYVLSDGNDAVDITQTTTEVPSSQLTAIALDVETANKKFGIAQIIEQKNCIGLIGGNVTLSFKAKVSSTAKLDNVKAAIVAWSGTADTVTSDIISAWEAEGTNPTLIADATFENTPANLSVTTSYATYTLSANVDTASTKNLIVFIWSDVTDTTAGDFLYLTDVQLEAGSTATDFERRPFGTELALCQRYFWKSFDQSVAPAQNVGSNNGALQSFGPATNVSFTAFQQLPVTMRAAPTVTTFSPDNASSDFTIQAGSRPTASIQNIGTNGFGVRGTGSVATGGAYAIHATASAEL